MTMASQPCYLRQGDDALEDATFHATLADACADYLASARELDRYGQAHTASLHFVDLVTDEPTEYPDRVLSLTSHGKLKVERT
jgi:hypothetical protein